ncbi:MAG: DEAD/DEAH box helicase [Planctomycetes bacterium]|nr:DEAD/DEAH box helicase [Planctomycetota bacterium]
MTSSSSADLTHAIGSLVLARGREWVVLPCSEPQALRLRPLDGNVAEEITLDTVLEPVQSARFKPPDPTRTGDFRSAHLLREALRLRSRAGAGPLRSFSRIAVEPRPYQLVPLLLALRLDPVRLLIADDVGIGKTIEASLIARELLDRGEIARICILCPPHLAEQWERELRQKFHLEATLVLSSTADRLERACGQDESIFDLHPITIVSLDFIKSDRRRDLFKLHAPELVIVDEAHTCAFGGRERSGRHQRYELLRSLAEDPSRHLILVTATPHSGKDDAFRSLLGILDPAFEQLPDDLSGEAHISDRRRLAAHLVQRRRGDILRYLETSTTFPTRDDDAEIPYRLSPAYRAFFNEVLAWIREKVPDPRTRERRARVRWWSALALLRSLASSPAAAEATLRSRARGADAADTDSVDAQARPAILDGGEDDDLTDLAPGADAAESEDTDSQAATAARERRRLRELADRAHALSSDADEKLLEAVRRVKQCLKDGFHPIVFCRFIPTAEYVAKHLREALPKDVRVGCVTGLLPQEEREAQVHELTKDADRRVLVATDCLSEGINLQYSFNAVLHYDLAWSPTRHEQREGRVDRFGQRSPKVRVLTLYGKDNRIDGFVLDILLQKHVKIRRSLGISVPLPADANAIAEAIYEGLLLRGLDTDSYLPGMEEYLRPRREDLHSRWDQAAQREKRSRTLFAQDSLRPEEVALELAQARDASGAPADVERFVRRALESLDAPTTEKVPGLLEVGLRALPSVLRHALGDDGTLTLRLPSAVREPRSGELDLSRTHPVVEGLAHYIAESALDRLARQAPAARSGVARSRAVSVRTTLLLVRLRFNIHTRRGPRGSAPLQERSQLAEEFTVLAFEGAPTTARWLSADAARALYEARPDRNVNPDQAESFVREVVEAIPRLEPALEAEAKARAAQLLEQHARVRRAAAMRHVSERVVPELPADVLGIYVFLPAV